MSAGAFFLELPWPPSSLSPNTKHGHWGGLQRAKDRYRAACCLATLDALRKRQVRDEPMRVRLEFRPPPDGRERDPDNLGARMKAGLDGVAQAMRINDRQFVEVTNRMGAPAESRVLARVSVTITSDAQPAESR